MTPSLRKDCCCASAMNVASGVASTSPNPNSGCERRRTTMVASRGGTSGLNGCGVSVSRSALLCMIEPPKRVSGSNLPSAIVPLRVTVLTLPPPNSGTL